MRDFLRAAIFGIRCRCSKAKVFVFHHLVVAQIETFENGFPWTESGGYLPGRTEPVQRAH